MDGNSIDGRRNVLCTERRYYHVMNDDYARLDKQNDKGKDALSGGK